MTPANIRRLGVIAVLGLLTFSAGCKSDTAKQTESDLVKLSKPVPFSRKLHADFVEKEKKQEKLPRTVHSFSGRVVGISSKRTESTTDLEVCLLLWSDPKTEAVCEFDSRSLDFVNDRKIGEELSLKGMVSSLVGSSVFVVGSGPDVTDGGQAP